MANKSTARFFQLMQEQNDQIRARVEAERAKTKSEQVGMDETRLRTDAERRERLGKLRARPHPSKRPRSGRPVLGYMEMGNGPGFGV